MTSLFLMCTCSNVRPSIHPNIHLGIVVLKDDVGMLDWNVLKNYIDFMPYCCLQIFKFCEWCLTNFDLDTPTENNRKSGEHSWKRHAPIYLKRPCAQLYASHEPSNYCLKTGQLALPHPVYLFKFILWYAWRLIAACPSPFSIVKLKRRAAAALNIQPPSCRHALPDRAWRQRVFSSWYLLVPF